MKSEVLEKQLAEIIGISKEFDVDKVWLFGSCLEGLDSAQDMDIAVKGVKPDRFFEMYGRILSAVDREVDLIPLEDTREHFSKRILEKGRLIYGKKA
ncbi:MAG: hypothetical protein B1H02_04900 [Candidatus Latescibacteria bacterium 4484_107]|nr:MAG: hypothetical protein B1H02_04900 [Candidatus Latescibacteria bacterium 4484_107]